MVFLLERLIASTDPAQVFDLEAAVSAQIQRIVCARLLESHDGEMSLLEFGMPNVVDIGYNSKTRMERYAARLKRLIMHYEPRLLYPTVTVEEMANSAAPYRLVVNGTLAPDGDARSFMFDLPGH